MGSAGVYLPLVLLAHAAVISANYYATQSPSTGPAGNPCSPPFGYRPNACGRHEFLNRTTERVCEYLFGPNVCLFTDTVRANVVEYRYSEGCDWVYSHYYYAWIRQCTYVCQPSGTCLEEMQTFVLTYEKCCPGFASRPVSSTYNPYASYHYSYYTPLVRDPGPGCPVAVGDSLLECLMIHGLTEFIKYAEKSVYFDIIANTSNSHITLFVPTNEALLHGQQVGFIPPPSTILFNISQLVGNHIVPGNVTAASLNQHGTKTYVNMEGRNLHRVSVSFADQSSVSYSQNSYYSYDPSDYQRTHEVIIPFINGAEVVNEEACNTVNATLHVINQVFTPIDSTIAEYLDDSRFSMFTALLGTAMILDFLDNPQVSRTVFVVEDEVIASTFPSELMSCIVNYMRRPLNDILLYHIGQGAYYSPSLEISSFFYTVLGEFLKVDTDEETGQILLGECEVPIIEPDIISASNGVIHVIDRVLFPDQFDFGMCSEFVPVPSPAECPVEPAPSPSPSPSPSPPMIMIPPSSLPMETTSPMTG